MKKYDSQNRILCACWVQAVDMLDWDDLQDSMGLINTHEIAEQVYAMNNGWE